MFQGAFAAEHRAFRGRDPLRGLPFVIRLRLGAGGKIIVHPHRLALLRRRRRLERARVGVFDLGQLGVEPLPGG